MEPFVAAAHVCRLPPGTLWLQDDGDAMTELEAVDWPDEVIRQEPGCSSRFQSYTAVAAAYTVAMVAESALLMLDTGSANAQVASWVRGQQYLDAHWPGLSLRDWARPAAPHNGILIERPFP
ncbi:MAG: molybdopterin biosynthesis protein [Gammaproteobacteria bacterium RIFOXYA12_FULL_61_12]|nr:MAG: molybdopterin biosynthesis protein [Gammaproteobacteria bacterium RIFOXYA12_FULL_61_12]OGT89444.1 MAG: molybdopterin biosynthesis protein [Gammaproteobacteria bacterium RIFOXYD12_FULL_61_37]